MMEKDHAWIPSGASRGQVHNVLSTNLPAAILVAALLIFWQAAAMGIDAAYILPSPTQVVVRLWELRGPLFKAHLPATMSVVGIGLLISIILGLGRDRLGRDDKRIKCLFRCLAGIHQNGQTKAKNNGDQKSDPHHRHRCRKVCLK